MAINRLQIRRDSLSDFQNAVASPLPGEPLYITDEYRIRVHDSTRTNAGRIPMQLPPSEGSQFHGIWNAAAYGTGAALTVPAVNGLDHVASDGDTYYANGEGARSPHYTAFSGALPRWFGRDAGIVKVNVSGDFRPGSTDPAMIFAFAFGDLEGTSETVVGAQPFQDLNFGGKHTVGKGYLEVGSGNGLQNALGDYDRPVLWNLDATIALMGTGSVSPFSSSLAPRGDHDGTADRTNIGEEATFRDESEMMDTDNSADPDNANVRIYGTLTVMDPFISTGNNLTNFHRNTRLPASVTSGGAINGCSWRDSVGTIYPRSLPRHTVVSDGVNSYESLGLTPGLDYADLTDAASIQRHLKLQAVVTPGSGSLWHRWFRPRKTVVDFSMEEYVPQLEDNADVFLKLKVGGPMQSSMEYTYPTWADADQGTTDGYFVGGMPMLVPGVQNPAYALMAASRVDYLPSSLQDATTSGLDFTARRITPGGAGDTHDYVCRICHDWTTPAATATGRMEDVGDLVNGSGAARAWAYESPNTDADGEWNCAWRRLADDRRDRMRIHHSTAYAFGGRVGTNDYRPL